MKSHSHRHSEERCHGEGSHGHGHGEERCHGEGSHSTDMAVSAKGVEEEAKVCVVYLTMVTFILWCFH
ncbi:hypothetical protein G9396_07230 [Providencia rettgeri]|nr:hypothetical protein G9396_07230 [Providencia rettgeri]